MTGKKEREGGRDWERGGRIQDFHLCLLFQILVLLSHTDSLPFFSSGSFPDQKEAVTYKLKGLCQHLSSAPNLRLGLLFFPPSSSQIIIKISLVLIFLESLHFSPYVVCEIVCPEKGYVQVLIPGPVSVTFFGNRVFAGVIKWRWGHLGFGWALNPMTCVHTRGEGDFPGGPLA